MLKVGIIGCGTIGTEISKAIDTKMINAKLVAVYDRSSEQCERLLGLLNNKPKKASPDELISIADIVIECASQKAVHEFGVRILESGKDLMVLSTGALTDSILLDRLIKAAAAYNRKIYIPSGAVAGLDCLKSASIAAIDKVTLTTTKNPQGLKGSPFVIEKRINPESFNEKTLLFEGSAEDAVRAFPSNVNVAATLSLAGTGAKETKVQVFVDPGAKTNIHEIAVEGAFGKFTCRVENIPSPDNPKTSFLAALSAIATLKKITEPLQIGT